MGSSICLLANAKDVIASLKLICNWHMKHTTIITRKNMKFNSYKQDVKLKKITHTAYWSQILHKLD